MLLKTLSKVDLSEQAQPLAWPNARMMFDGAFEVGAERRLKYWWRLARTRRERGALLEALRLFPLGRALFSAQPRAFYPVMSHLLDRRLGAKARLEATVASLFTVCNAVDDEPTMRQLLTQGLTLLELVDGTCLRLSLNDVSFHEGLWQVALLTPDGRRLYSLGFGLLSAKTILIGNVQGPSITPEKCTGDGDELAGTDGLGQIRAATHAAHGMRPPHLLLHALRQLGARWEVENLKGVDPEFHVKGRWNLRGSRLRFDYRAFWSELGGQRTPAAQGNWQLPLLVQRRPLEEVATKRRGTYRRRYALLDVLEQRIALVIPAAVRHATGVDVPARNAA